MNGISRQPVAGGSSLDAAILELQRWSNPDGPGPDSRLHMAERITALDRRFGQSDSPELCYWLGIATRSYVVWHVRGDARRHYLARAVRQLERAFAVSAGRLPEYAPAAPLDRVAIACSLGALLVDEAAVRELDRGIACLELAFHAAKHYEPALCHYANGLYKRGDYQRAADAALELYRRAACSPERRDSIPLAPLEIAAKAYRALARVHKKRGENAQAIAALKRLVELGRVTENDRLLLGQVHPSPAIVGLLSRATTPAADHAIVT